MCSMVAFRAGSWCLLLYFLSFSPEIQDTLRYWKMAPIGWAEYNGEPYYDFLPFWWLPAGAHRYQSDQDKDASCGKDYIKGASFCEHRTSSLASFTLTLWHIVKRRVKIWTDNITLLTINGEFQGQAVHTANRVLHQTAVDIIIHQQHSRKCQNLLVRWQQQASVINQRLSALRPAVRGLGSRVVRTVQS